MPLLGDDAAAARLLERLDRRGGRREPEGAGAGQVEVWVESSVRRLVEPRLQALRPEEVRPLVRRVLVAVVGVDQVRSLGVPRSDPRASQLMEGVLPRFRPEAARLELEVEERRPHLRVRAPVAGVRRLEDRVRLGDHSVDSPDLPVELGSADEQPSVPDPVEEEGGGHGDSLEARCPERRWLNHVLRNASAASIRRSTLSSWSLVAPMIFTVDLPSEPLEEHQLLQAVPGAVRHEHVEGCRQHVVLPEQLFLRGEPRREVVRDEALQVVLPRSAVLMGAMPHEHRVVPVARREWIALLKQPLHLEGVVLSDQRVSARQKHANMPLYLGKHSNNRHFARKPAKPVATDRRPGDSGVETRRFDVEDDGRPLRR